MKRLSKRIGRLATASLFSLLLVALVVTAIVLLSDADKDEGIKNIIGVCVSL